MVKSIRGEMKEKKEWIMPHWDGGSLNVVFQEVEEWVVGKSFLPGEEFSR